MAPGFVALGRDGAIYFIDLVGRTEPGTGLWSYRIVRWTPQGGAQPLASVPGFPLFSAPPLSLAADAEGRVYLISPRGVQRVEEGRLVTVAGDPPGNSFPGQPGNVDGQGTAARFNSLRAATIDAAGNLYIADGELIRRVTPGGLVTTVAGTRGSVGLHLGELPGSLASVSHLALAPDGSLLAVSGTALVRIRLP
jgi:hypothetical protein